MAGSVHQPDAPVAPAETRTASVLDPPARISEVLFGLIMALTFTGSLSVATAGRDDVREMLVGAIGCNIAWGLIDAVMFLLAQITERGRSLRMLRSVRAAGTTAEAHAVIANVLPARVARALPPGSLEAVRADLVAKAEPPNFVRLRWGDLRGAIGVFLLVVVATFPVVVPFLVFSDASAAMRVSNGVAVALLFLCGFRLGQFADHRPWAMGLGMAVVGMALVGITIALGG